MAERRCTRYDAMGIAGEPKDGKISRNSPALVICIAALKARQAVPQPGCPELLAPNPNTDAAQET